MPAGAIRLAAGVSGAEAEGTVVAKRDCDLPCPSDVVRLPDGAFLHAADIGNDSIKVLDQAVPVTLGACGVTRGTEERLAEVFLNDLALGRVPDNVKHGHAGAAQLTSGPGRPHGAGQSSRVPIIQPGNIVAETTPDTPSDPDFIDDYRGIRSEVSSAVLRNGNEQQEWEPGL